MCQSAIIDDLHQTIIADCWNMVIKSVHKAIVCDGPCGRMRLPGIHCWSDWCTFDKYSHTHWLSCQYVALPIQRASQIAAD
jgi:hypothetical protein